MHVDILGSVLTPVWFVTRSQRRTRRATLIGLGLFVGIISALSMSLIAGARRSASVVDRFFSAAPHYDAQVFAPELARSDVLALPGVKRADPDSYIALTYVGSQPTLGINGIAMDFNAPANPTIRVLHGRMPDGKDPTQVAVNDFFAQQLAVSVGDRVPVQMFAPDQYDEVQQGIYEPRGPKYELTVAAVVRLPEDIALDEGRSPISSAYRSPIGLLLSFGFWEQHHHAFSISARTISCNWPMVPRDCPH